MEEYEKAPKAFLWDGIESEALHKRTLAYRGCGYTFVARRSTETNTRALPNQTALWVFEQ